MVLEELGDALVGALIGAIASFGFLYKWENDKKRQELNRIRQIINDDFFRIYSASQDLQKFILKTLKNEDKSLDNLIYDTMDNSKKGSTVSLILDFRQDFLLWNSIVTSGSLVKLESQEIQMINSTHDFIESVIVSTEKHLEELNEKLPQIYRGKSTNPFDFTKVLLHVYLQLSYIELNEIIKRFDFLCENITWMKHEFSTSKLLEINPTYVPDEKGELWMFPFEEEKPNKKTPI